MPPASFLARIVMFGALSLFLPTAAQASLVQDAADIATDPLKLGRASARALASVEHIEKIIRDLDSLEIRTNTDIANRLAEVKGITSQIIDAADRNMAVAARLVDRLSQIENDIFDKATILIVRAECFVKNASDELVNALKRAALVLKQADPKVVFLGIPIVNVRTGDVIISNPLEGFTSVADQHLNELNNLTEQSPAREVIKHYSEIVRLAKRAQCAYLNDPVANWIRDRYIVPYSEIAGMWITVIHPR